MQEKVSKPITLRRDGKGPLKFTGERIGSASRQSVVEGDDNVTRIIETKVRVFKTASGKYILGVECYNRTDEEYDGRHGWVGNSLLELVEEVKRSFVNLDDDILAEVFEDTEVGDRFIEHVE